MSKDFVLTTDELFGSYCYIEQKRYGVPNEKFLYKIIGKFTSNAWSIVPVDANDKEPHIFNHSEEVINVVCCGVCEDKIERYKLSDVEIISNKDQQIADLETKLAESEKQIKDAREAGNMAVDSWCKNRRKYEAQIAEIQNKSFILYSMLYETLEKQGCDNVASQIDQMTGWTYDKEADWLKGNRNYDQLKQQLAESEKKAYSRGHSQRDIANEIKLNALREDVANKEKRIVELKQQLVEKDKEIETILKENEELVIKHNVYNWGDKIQKDKVYSLTGEVLELLINRQNQKAIEQLEQIINLFEPYENEEKDTILCANNGISFLEFIDNQINQLKEGK